MKWPIWYKMSDFVDGQKFSANCHGNILIDRQNLLYGMFRRNRSLFQQSWKSGILLNYGGASIVWQGSMIYKSYLPTLNISAQWTPIASGGGSVTLALQGYMYSGGSYQWVTIDTDTRTNTPGVVYFKNNATNSYNISGYTWKNNEVRVRFMISAATGNGGASSLRCIGANLSGFTGIPSWSSLSFSDGVVYSASSFNALKNNQEHLLYYGRFPNTSAWGAILSQTLSGWGPLWYGAFQYRGAGQIFLDLNVINAGTIEVYVNSASWYEGSGQYRQLVAHYDTTGSRQLTIDLTTLGLTYNGAYMVSIEGSSGAAVDMFRAYWMPRSSEGRTSGIISALTEKDHGDILYASFLNGLYSDQNNMKNNGPYICETVYNLQTYQPFTNTSTSEEVHWMPNYVDGTQRFRFTNFYRWLYYRGTNVKLHSYSWWVNPASGNPEPLYTQSLPDASDGIVCADLSSINWITPGIQYLVENAWVAYEYYEATV